MSIWNLKRNIERSYIWYLLEDVNVLPKKDYTISILDEKFNLIVGEEKKVPRFIAHILHKHGIVDFEDDSEDYKKILSKLLYLSSEAKQIQLLRVSPSYYASLLDALATLREEKQKIFTREFESLLKIRLPKVLHRIHTGSAENLDFIEKLMLNFIKQLVEEIEKELPSKGIEIIRELKSMLIENQEENSELLP